MQQLVQDMGDAVHLEDAVEADALLWRNLSAPPLRQPVRTPRAVNAPDDVVAAKTTVVRALRRIVAGLKADGFEPHAGREITGYDWSGYCGAMRTVAEHTARALAAPVDGRTARSASPRRIEETVRRMLIANPELDAELFLTELATAAPIAVRSPKAKPTARPARKSVSITGPADVIDAFDAAARASNQSRAAFLQALLADARR